MQSESSAQPRMAGAELENTECPNCHAMLPRGMRFCRACGYRLGEGLDEYVETVRLKPRVSGEARPGGATTNAAGQTTDPFQAQSWGAMAQQQAAQAQQMGINAGAKACAVKRKKMGWMTWVIIAIIAISVLGGGVLTPLALRLAGAGNRASIAASKKSYFGVKGFRTADGGAFMDYAFPPGGPADKAGLLGGDVIINFDGMPVKGDDDIMRILAATPIGKTVDVTFIRDGQQRTTKLTTISREEYDSLQEDFENGPKGYLKEGTDIDRVIVPGMNIYGVRLNRISKSGPADMAGIKDGDIVIEYGGIPTRTRRELEMRIERSQPYSTVPVVLIRDGQRMEIQVKVGQEPD